MTDTQMERCPSCGRTNERALALANLGEGYLDHCFDPWHSTPAAPETAPPDEWALAEEFSLKWMRLCRALKTGPTANTPESIIAKIRAETPRKEEV